jgi:hypothetical protein
MAEARSLPHHGPGSVVISDEMSSDLTSHSYTSTPASSTTNLDVPSQPLNPERQPQSIELESYIPLGCLVSGAAAIALDYPTWTEVTTVALLEKDINRRLEIATLRLLDARWIRVHAKDFEKRTILRVYLLPDDIGQVQVARTSKSLRVHLEVLLSWLCLSVMTWNGILEGLQQHFDPWAAVEEGSLFYIFNTLPSPNPQP